MWSYKRFEIDWKYLLAGAVCILFIMSRYFLPEFLDNENIYSVHTLKLLDPEYLKYDPFMGGISYFTLIFSVASLPFYAVFDPLIALMIIRVLIWTFQIWALLKLTRTLGLTWWSFILFIILFINIPSRLAGEWIIGSAASKPVSYAFVFLSLDALLKNKIKKAGMFSGAAVSLHVLSGGWSALAIFITILINSWQNRRLKDVINFGISSFMFSIPGLLPALLRVLGVVGNKNLLENASLPIENADKIYVTFANPFHLDPTFFIQGLEVIKVMVIFAAPIILYKLFLKKEYASIMNKFLTIIIVFFLMGIIAGKLELYQFTKYYPFRVADGLLPMNLWIGFSLMIQSLFKGVKYQKTVSFSLIPFIMITSNYLIDISEPQRRYRTFIKLLKHTEPRETPYRTKDTLERLYNKFMEKKFDGFEDMADWINSNTPQDSIFITPPIEYEFALKAQRAQVVTYKCVPPGKKIFLWKQRMEDLNGGKFIQEGKGWMYMELKKNYPKLEEYEIRAMKNKYGADYIMTTTNGYKGFEIVYQNQIYTLYKIL